MGDLKQTIREYEEELAATAEGRSSEADTASVLLAWARDEDVDPARAKRLLERAEESQ